ncbi:cyclic nucleotide-binding protein [Oleiphilus messinensis]|uniref:Cyclic nucleotide-binding protein n=2 Tax=Oleiphilus messinensis TaxID=141451 RepID=A0A1Y0IBY7_9GAMM|nr:cyclic nucleotide-binding protein [Oleiphilus messinensis]
MAQILDKTSWANDFSWEQILKLCRYFDYHEIVGGTVVFEQGSTEREMGVLISGVLSVLRTEGGQEFKLVQLRPPQTFGEIALIDGQPRSAKAVAVDDVVYLAIRKAQLDKLVNDHPLIAYKLMWKISLLLSQRLRQTSSKLVEYLDQ